MKFGLFDHIDRRPNEAPTKTYTERMMLVQAAEKAGFYGYHLAEHHWTPLSIAPSPGLVLAAAIQHTKTMKIGSMVHLLPLYHPLRVIEEVCMLDHMSNGRFQFGVGRGVSPFEVGYFGVNGTESRARYQETLEIVLQGLTHPSLDYHGRYYHFDDVPMELRPLQAPFPQIWAGASADSAEYLAQFGAHVVALGPAPVVKATLDKYRAVWDKYAAQRKAHGLTIEKPFLGHSLNIFVAETDAEAEKLAAPAFQVFQDALAHLWLKHRARPAFIVPDLATARKLRTSIIGSPATVRELLEERVSQTGADYSMLEMAWGTLGHEAEMRSLQLFAAEVMPHFM